mgnify:CR=1 FL=1
MSWQHINTRKNILNAHAFQHKLINFETTKNNINEKTFIILHSNNTHSLQLQLQ